MNFSYQPTFETLTALTVVSSYIYVGEQISLDPQSSSFSLDLLSPDCKHRILSFREKNFSSFSSDSIFIYDRIFRFPSQIVVICLSV